MVLFEGRWWHGVGWEVARLAGEANAGRAVWCGMWLGGGAGTGGGSKGI